MSEYKPSMHHFRRMYANRYKDEAAVIAAEAEFDRALSAHDAEVRAGVVAEEPEWEYGAAALEDDGEGPRPLSEDRDYWPDGIAAHASDPDERTAHQIVDAWTNASLIRRRKAGPWEPVKQEGDAP